MYLIGKSRSIFLSFIAVISLSILALMLFAPYFYFQIFIAIIHFCADFSLHGFISYFVSFPNFFASLFFLLSFIGFLKASLFFFREIFHIYQLKKSLLSNNLDQKKNNIYHHIDSPQIFAFNLGLLSPQIFISNRTKSILNPEEFQAVLAHELHHQRNYHSLILFILEIINRLLFFLPPISELTKYLASKLELSADQSAIEKTSKKNLISALVAILENQPHLKTSASMPSFSTLNERISSLIDDQQTSKLEIKIFPLVFSCLMLTVFAFSFIEQDYHNFLESKQCNCPQTINQL